MQRLPEPILVQQYDAQKMIEIFTDTGYVVGILGELR